LLYFVIRDYLGKTPLENLRNTLYNDIKMIWEDSSKVIQYDRYQLNLSKLEKSLLFHLVHRLSEFYFG
jgi:hypothetical protein